MKRRFLIGVLLAGVLLTGCSLATEVGERAFVQLMGIEREDEVYMVSLQVYKSESSGAEPDVSKANSVSVNGRGTTIYSALADAENTLGKKLFLGHIKLLVIGGGIENPADELSLFLDGTVSPSCPVAYSENPSAVAQTLFEEGSFSAEKVMALMSNAASQGKTVYTTVAELAADTGVLNCAAALPVITASDDSVKFSGITFARKNGTAGLLSEDDALGAKLLLGQFESGDKITVPVNIDGNRASVFITGAKTDLKTEITDGVLNINAVIKLKIAVAENPCGVSMPLIEQAVCENVRDSCISAFSTAVWYNSCDIFGIKKLVRRDCPDFYEEYCTNEKQLLAESVLNVKVTDKAVNSSKA